MTAAEAPAEPVFGLNSLVDPAFSKCPHPYYKQMRETNPVLRAGDDESAIVFLGTHADVDHVLHTPEMFSSKFHEGSGMDADPLIPINIDPPDHRMWRRLLDPLFNPRSIARLEEDIRRRVNEHIDTFIERGECDYADEFAVPLPCEVFLELMGLPLADLDAFLDLKERLLRGSAGQFMGHDEVQVKAREELTERFEKLLSDRRADPQDDLMSGLLAAQVGERPLSHEEVLGACHLMFIAGLDTVTDSLTCMYAYLAENPDQRRLIVEDPGLIPQAIEEMLRYESPVLFVPRVATEEMTLGGCPVHPGERVILLLGAANVDPAAVHEPDVVDFGRPSTRHYAFGGGIHRCLGSHLARAELRISLTEWHRRIPDYRIKPGTELEFAPLLRQVHHLPLEFEKVNP